MKMLPPEAAVFVLAFAFWSFEIVRISIFVLRALLLFAPSRFVAIFIIFKYFLPGKKSLSEDAEKIWDTVGGSMWEIQDILSQLFEYPIDDVLADYRQKMRGIITYYIVQKERKKREKILSHFIANDYLGAKDTNENDSGLLKDMVVNNILDFDPTLAVYYPQGKSYRWGIRLYFEQ